MMTWEPIAAGLTSSARICTTLGFSPCVAAKIAPNPDHADRNPHSTNAGFSAHPIRLLGNAVELAHGHLLIKTD
jgi:hypothetical protein